MIWGQIGLVKKKYLGSNRLSKKKVFGSKSKKNIWQ
jgi:hypothetical protein